MNFKDARDFMCDQLNADESLWLSYQANIAMLIYDDQMAGAESRSTKPATNLNTKEGCNAMAERLIKLIFCYK